MAGIATLWTELEVRDGDGVTVARRVRDRWAAVSIKRETVTLATGWNAFSPPSGAQFVLMVLGTATGLTLKGVTGDTGIPIAPASSPLGLDVLLPLGDAPALGLTATAGGAQIELIWTAGTPVEVS